MSAEVASPQIAISSSTADPELAVRWIVRLRWASVIAEAVTVLVATFALRIPLATTAIGLLIGALAVSNAGLQWWRREHRPTAAVTLGGVLLADTALLTLLLYFSGGPWNPFTSLYLVYVTLAALALGMAWASAVVVAAALGYICLFYAHVPVCILEHDHNGGTGLPVHLQTMWVAFVVTATVVAYFVSRVARALRERDAELARAQRIAARNEKLVSLSTLAAGAAHELGTPLATIAVAAREVERVLERASASTDDARLIGASVERCRRIVLQMSGRSSEGLGEIPQSSTIDSVLGELRERTLAGGPERLAVDVHPRVPSQVVVPREGLVQALACLVRNAVDASAVTDPVLLRVSADGRRLRFAVEDRGAGIGAEVLSRLGEPFFTTKQAGRGMGLGIFLARAFAERWDGSLAIDSAPGLGTRATLEIALAASA
jgi:two-component system sensor histidine kinase RegB